MLFRQIFDPKLAQYAYLIGCQQTKEALLIDPERDIDQYLDLAEKEGLTITAIAETHIHADFLSGAREFAERFGTKLYLSAEGEGEGWGSNWAKENAYDVTFLHDGDTFPIGHIEIKAIHTPGHTPEHMSYLVTDRGAGATTPIGIATGDFLFVGDLGRPDLLEQAAGMHGVQEPSARTLFHSLPKLRTVQDYVQVWPAHGAGSTCGKALGAVPQSTIGYEQLYNASLGAAKQGEEAFVDAILAGQPEPQMYFARMKRDNRDGVPMLGRLPQPQKLTVGEFSAKVQDRETLIIDTRLDRSAFMARHVPGALYAPMNKSFNTVVGSLVVDETTPIALVIEDGSVEEAVRDFVRIGYDNIVGFITPGGLQRYFDQGGKPTMIEEITFAELYQMQNDADKVAVDVRFASEFVEGHVPNAINASYTRLPDYAKDRLPSAKTLMVYCATGARSAAAAAFLAQQGYTVTYVNGDFTDYHAVGEVAAGEPVAA